MPIGISVTGRKEIAKFLAKTKQRMQHLIRNSAIVFFRQKNIENKYLKMSFSRDILDCCEKLQSGEILPNPVTLDPERISGSSLRMQLKVNSFECTQSREVCAEIIS
jgi:hypothetical protein